MNDFRVDTLDVDLLFLGTTEKVFAAMYEDSFCGYKAVCEVEQLRLPIKVFGLVIYIFFLLNP